MRKENLGLERDVNLAVSMFYGFPLSTFVYFSNYWRANDRKRKRYKGSKIQACHIAQFTKLG